MSYSELGKDVRTIIQRLGEIERELQGQKEGVEREYRILRAMNEEDMNKLGAEGFELVLCEWLDFHGWFLLFKRQKKGQI